LIVALAEARKSLFDCGKFPHSRRRKITSASVSRP
jgi:hypothetical protein